MTAEQFAYWLQGYAELNDAPPSGEQWQAIRDHLALVFNKVTPQLSPLRPAWPAPLDMRARCTALASGDGETRLVC